MDRTYFSVLILVTFSTLARGHDPVPFVVPTGQWAGVDGNWSTLQFSLGQPAQSVQVLASTSLSEFWAVSNGGCLPSR